MAPGGSTEANTIGVEIDFNKASNDRYGQWLAAKLSQLMVTYGVRVVNLSLGLEVAPASTTTTGTSRPNDWLTQLIKGKREVAVFVVAAGNQPDLKMRCVTVPACNIDTHINIVSVVAMDIAGVRVMHNANYNRKFTIGTVGEQIFGPVPENKFSVFSGSSQAAAVVSGAVSLAISLGGNYAMAPYQIRQRLIACSNFSGTELLDKMTGGDLDFDCLEKATTDIAYRSSGAHQASLLTGELKPTKLHFTDFDTNITTEIPHRPPTRLPTPAGRQR